MSPSGMREWFFELAANPLLILAVVVIIRVIVVQHKQNLDRLFRLHDKLEEQTKIMRAQTTALHEMAMGQRANADRVIAAIDRTMDRVRERDRERGRRHEDDTR